MATLVVAPASAAATLPATPLAAYVRARAADADGAVTVAAQGYAEALAAQPADPVIAVRALRQALASGDLPLARRAGAVLRAADVAPPDLDILAFSDAVIARDTAAQRAALARLAESPLGFLGPLLASWVDLPAPPVAVDGGPIPRRYAAENAALRLLATGQTREGIAATRTLLTATGGDADFRLNAAQLLVRAGERDTARALLAGDDPVLARAAETLGRGSKGDARFGVSRLFARMAGDLSAQGTESLAIMLARSALLLDPTYSRARIALADALARDDAIAAAKAVLAAIRPGDPFAGSANALGIVILQRAGDLPGALALARTQAERPGAATATLRRYADLQLETGEAAAAAQTYARALAQAGQGADWTLYLQRGAALDQSGDWAGALPMLRRAVELGPQEPVALNYLGYAQVDHGENVPEATRMLERAHALAPRDPAIADSLGWARFRAGNIAAALPLIEGAVRRAPDDVEINEHLGDVYWAAGRRVEARYAWAAASVAAEGAVAQRLASKLANGPASSHR
ncbi:tetratricopeptide repeat protein [Sphingomonas sp. 2R-10]|uniref:tetratricopeptide repeat protein n=1 Tax=Sphingomonas sp. 2R-10 TaxID=3045148 RepID=UPI0019D02EAD|nr:tetratricopeptide repeat protein [Sphingomonas sp. 2R-10]MDJ0277088.1 tetratricopeptide repeat protein [Sphingomonas sp. 2R-10]